MASNFIPLTTITITHGYFAGNIPTVLALEPDDATRHDMLRLGLMSRIQGNRLVIFYDAVFAGTPRSREQVLANDLRLVFTMQCTDPNFFGYTSVPDLKPLSNYLFLFTNQPIGSQTIRDTLQANPYAGAEELVALGDLDQTFFSKPFGQVRVHLHAGLSDQLQISFGVNETYWRYVLTSPHLKELISPAIIHAETREAFIGPENLVLPDNREALVFRSVAPIPITAVPNKNLQLVEHFEPETGKGRIVIGVMPNPSPGSYSMLGLQEEGKKYSEVFL